MKKVASKLIFFILKVVGGSSFANPLFDPLLQLRHFIIQKILRRNSHVPWPVHWTSVIKSPRKIKKGNRNPGLSMGCYIDGRNGIKFGDNVWVGPKVSIISMNHNIYNYYKYEESDAIEIGNNCWLGAGSIILPGVKLGDHVIVAAGAVVAKSFLDNDIILAGVPAKIVKSIGEYDEVSDIARNS